MNSKFTMIVRVLLGLILVVSGLNKFIQFIPTPASTFIDSLGQLDYVFPVVGVFELIIGGMLLVKRWVPFALLLLVPISLNIVLFHIYLNFSNVGAAVLVALLNGILIYKHWRVYRPLFN